MECASPILSSPAGTRSSRNSTLKKSGEKLFFGKNRSNQGYSACESHLILPTMISYRHVPVTFNISRDSARPDMRASIRFLFPKPVSFRLEISS